MEKYIDDYLVYLEVISYAEKTRQFVRITLGLFLKWLKENGIKSLSEITLACMFSYQEYLKERIDQFDKKESVESQRKKLQIVRSFLVYLKDGGFILSNPAEKLKLPRVRRSIPRDILSAQEVEKILCKPDVKKTLGLRDRAMLELLYATGMRRMELSNLRLSNIDFKEQVLEIRNSKAAKDRIIPVSDRALKWLAKYLGKSRPALCSEESGDFVFLIYQGRSFKPSQISKRLKKYLAQSGLGHKGACHVFRHTFATQMLEAGVDLRLIQEMLGHSDADVTRIYTRVSIRKLQEVHAKTHPAKPMGMSKRYWEEKTSGQSDEVEPETIQSFL
jgi:integrase/recombinase XerD